MCGLEYGDEGDFANYGFKEYSKYRAVINDTSFYFYRKSLKNRRGVLIINKKYIKLLKKTMFMKTRMLIICFFVLGCNQSTNDCFRYPPVITSLKMENGYDAILEYCYFQYASSYKCIDWNNEVLLDSIIPLINHDIHLDSIRLQGDTIAFFIKFTINEYIECNKVKRYDNAIEKPINEITLLKVNNKVVYFIDSDKDKDYDPFYEEQETKTIRTKLTIDEVLKDVDRTNCWLKYKINNID
jgi:hypothetical protein